MLARARTCTCGLVSDASSYTCRREPWPRCAPTPASAYFCSTFRGLPFHPSRPQLKDERRGRGGAGYTGRSHHGASREPRRDAGQAQGGGAGRHSSDEEWNADNYEDEDEDGRIYLDASKCGRVRLHAVQGAAQSSSGLGVDDERRKSLADKGWARRTVVVNSVGASGAASFESVPG